MSFLNLMQNRLKPKEVNEALEGGGSSGGGKVKTFTWTGNGNVPNVLQIPDDVGIILDIEQDNTGEGYLVAPFKLKSSGKYTLISRASNTLGSVSYSYSNGTLSLGAGAVGIDEAFNRGPNTYTMYYLPIETN